MFANKSYLIDVHPHPETLLTLPKFKILENTLGQAIVVCRHADGVSIWRPDYFCVKRFFSSESSTERSRRGNGRAVAPFGKISTFLSKISTSRRRRRRHSVDIPLTSYTVARRGSGRHIVQFPVCDSAHAQNQPAGSWTPVSARINDLIKRYSEITSLRLHRYTERHSKPRVGIA